MRQLALMTALALPLGAEAHAQEEDDANVVGSVTATIAAEETTFVVVTNGNRSSGFEREEGEVLVNMVAVPDRTPMPETPVLEIAFRVTGMGPTADATDASIRLITEDGTLSTMGGTSEVSMTAFGVEADEVTVAGNFASQLQDEAGGLAPLAIEGDFQASIRQPDFAGTD